MQSPTRIFRLLLLMRFLSSGPELAATEPSAPKGPMTRAELEYLMATKPPGDRLRGEKLHQSLFCSSCHGERGTAETLNWPHLAGQKATYTYKALVDFQRGVRAGTESADLMRDACESVPLQELADLAAFYASLPAPADTTSPRPGSAHGSIATLVRKGSPTRLLTPCASCHGAKGQGGLAEASALAGQNPKFLVEALKAFQEGTRASDLQRSMRFPATRLSAEEISALATYYADLPGKR